MKYELTIEGGFVGIPKTYKGERHLHKEEKNQLLQSLQKTNSDKNINARDTFNYKLKLIDHENIYKYEFEEFDIPKEVRMFIESIIKK
ncbi:MAG: hypothetical protein R3243_14905 [Arenibacter latericius]|nr:hypothetical protein [Arenibacter latericius]